MAHGPHWPTRWSAVLRSARAHARATMRARGHPRAATWDRAGSGREAPVRAPSAPACARRRDVPRGCLTGRHSATTHADLGITSSYLRGIDNTEIIHAVHEQPTPMIPATSGLKAKR